jgi:hypothetical protein
MGHLTTDLSVLKPHTPLERHQTGVPSRFRCRCRRRAALAMKHARFPVQLGHRLS